MSTGIGEALRAAREQQGLSLEDAAADLRGRVDQVVALEEERFDAFGGDVYAKGFLRNYAVELGLDPEPLLEIYRREISHDDVHAPSFVGGVNKPPKQRSSPPPWLVWLLAGVVIVAGLAFLSTVGSGVAPPTASPDEPIGSPPPSVEPDDEEPDPTDGTGEQDEDEPAPTDETDASEDDDANDANDADDPDDADDDEQTEEETEPAAPEGVELLVAFEEASWMRVIIDGTTVLETIISEGETRQWRGDEEIEVRYGNAGGVRVDLNGEDLGAPGTRGQVVTVRYTPDGAEQL